MIACLRLPVPRPQWQAAHYHMLAVSSAPAQALFRADHWPFHDSSKPFRPIRCGIFCKTFAINIPSCSRPS